MAQPPKTLPGWVWLVAFLVLTLVPAALRAPAPSDSTSSSANLIFSARYALGIARIAGFAAGGFLDTLDAAADSPMDRLRLIPVAAEIEGADAALSRIERARAEAGISPDDAQDLDILDGLYRGHAISARETERLIERHGWFGELAAVYNRPAADPDRRRVLDRAMRSAIALLAAFAAAILAGVAGFILLILAFARNVKFAFADSVKTPQRNDILWIETAALSVGLVGLPAALPAAAGAAIALLMPAFLLWWPRLRGSTWEEWRRATGLHRGRGVWREAAAGLVGYVAALPVFLLGLLATLWIASHFQNQAAHPIVDQIAKGGLPGIAFAYAAACLWAPLVEETLFRGMLYHFLRRRAPTALSVPLVGLLFAALHPQGFAAVPALAALGAMLCLIREWRSSLIAPTVAHAIHNFAIITLVLVVLD